MLISGGVVLGTLLVLKAFGFQPTGFPGPVWRCFGFSKHVKFRLLFGNFGWDLASPHM